MPTAHAACSPSSASMWLNCPASVTCTKDVLRPSSKYAREGTAAHHVAELTIKGDIFLPDKVEVEGEQFIVSPGMCQALNPYIGHVQSLMALPGAISVIEQRVMVPGTRNKVWGTLDCGVQEITNDLHIADLKFGKGVAVEPDSPQLKLYGIGFASLMRVERPSTKVTLTVCQPRISTPGGPLRSHVTTVGELDDWRRAVVTPAINKIANGDTAEVSGAWCRWCVRQTACKAFAGRHQKHAASAFDDMEPQPKGG